MKKHLVEWTEELDLVQKVQGITRYRLVTTANGNSKAESSWLDHVYISDVLKSDVVQIPTAWSYLEVILATVKMKISYKMQKSKTKLRVWKDYKVDILIDRVSPSDDINELQANIYNSLNYMSPLREVRFKTQRGDLLDTKIVKITKKRDRYLKKFKLLFYSLQIFFMKGTLFLTRAQIVGRIHIFLMCFFSQVYIKVKHNFQSNIDIFTEKYMFFRVPPVKVQ